MSRQNIRIASTAILVCSLISSFSIPYTCARLCQINSQSMNITASSDLVLYQCPRPEDPPHFTDCCYSGIQVSGTCCERKSHGFIFGLDDRILIAISVGVIIACLLSSILVLICCFCSKCPLYSVCHSKYQHNDTIAFTTKEELMKLNGMPNEDYKVQKGYELNAVQVRPVLYDA